jgi:enoyl-CoA hydratase
MDSVLTSREGKVLVVTVNRPQARNAVDSATATALAEVFTRFDKDDRLDVAILTGSGGTFCAGADLREIAEGRRPPVDPNGSGPMGPTWLEMGKPVIAAVEGYAVAGGLELALWCDLRVASRGAIFGVFNRRWGVPLIDLGTVRLPRIVGHGRAMDLILTGRAVEAEEALQMGLVNRVVANGKALEAALATASSMVEFPQESLRGDRLSACEQWSLSFKDARKNELRRGIDSIESGQAASGAGKFARGRGRHGSFE